MVVWVFFAYVKNTGSMIKHLLLLLDNGYGYADIVKLFGDDSERVFLWRAACGSYAFFNLQGTIRFLQIKKICMPAQQRTACARAMGRRNRALGAHAFLSASAILREAPDRAEGCRPRPSDLSSLRGL